MSIEKVISMISKCSTTGESELTSDGSIELLLRLADSPLLSYGLSRLSSILRSCSLLFG
jgi:hypothetical protein